MFLTLVDNSVLLYLIAAVVAACLIISVYLSIRRDKATAEAMSSGRLAGRIFLIIGYVGIPGLAIYLFFALLDTFMNPAGDTGMLGYPLLVLVLIVMISLIAGAYFSMRADKITKSPQ